MTTGRRRASHPDSLRVTNSPSLRVQIVDHLHMVRDEADWNNYDILAARSIPKHAANIGLQPGLASRTAAALVNQTPRIAAERMPDQAARFVELPAIIADLGHRQRNAVRGEDDPGVSAAAAIRNFCQRATNAIRLDLNK